MFKTRPLIIEKLLYRDYVSKKEQEIVTNIREKETKQTNCAYHIYFYFIVILNFSTKNCQFKT